MNIPATILIVSKNREHELKNALRSAVLQKHPVEILVIDDGSTDNSSLMVQEEYPNVRLLTFAGSSGCIVRRNEGIHRSSGDIVFSIDDDAEFSTSDIVENTIKDFDDPRIGAVAIPFIEPKKGEHLYQSPPDTENPWITEAFKGTAFAVRKDIFLKLGGFREHLVHQGEESDFCIRLLDAGYVVRLGRSAPITHWESHKRDYDRVDYFGVRNSILFAWQNVPTLYMPLNLVVTTFKCLIFTLVPKRFANRLAGIARAYREMPKTNREPVSKETFLTWRKLRKEGPILLTDLDLKHD